MTTPPVKWEWDQNNRMAQQAMPSMVAVVNDWMGTWAQAGPIDDMRNNIDVHFAPRPVRTGALRVRDAGKYLASYGHEITIRTRAQFGGETEVHKYRKGIHADIFVYGFATVERGDVTGLVGLTVVDGAQLAAYLAATAQLREYPNHDGTRLAAIDLAELPDAVLYRSPALPPLRALAPAAAAPPPSRGASAGCWQGGLW